MKIDCLVTDGDQSVKAEVSGDLFGAPILLQLLVDQGEVRLREVAIPARPGSSCVRVLAGLARPVGAIVSRHIAPQLSRDGASVPPQAA